MRKFLIGVDPGASGGIAWIENGLAKCRPAPETDEELLSLLREALRACASEEKSHAVIELVGGYVKPPRIVTQPGTPLDPEEKIKIEGGQPGSAMFRFGESAGLVRGMLLALGVTCELVAPRAWLKAFALQKSRDMTKGEWKNVLKARAEREFPQTGRRDRVTLKTCDALLILQYARLKYQGESVRRAEPQTGQGEAAAREGELFSEEPKPVPVSQRPPGLAIYEWRGVPFVAKGAILVRKATEADLQTLPKVDKLPGK